MALLLGDASSIISVDIAIEEQPIKNPYIARSTVISIRLKGLFVPMKNKVKLTTANEKCMDRSIRFIPILSMIIPALRKPAIVPVSASDEMIMSILSGTSRYFFM